MESSNPEPIPGEAAMDLCMGNLKRLMWHQSGLDARDAIAEGKRIPLRAMYLAHLQAAIELLLEEAGESFQNMAEFTLPEIVRITAEHRNQFRQAILTALKKSVM